MTHLVWFRGDLRTHDNPALYAACQHADRVIGLVCLTAKQWQQHQLGKRRIQLIQNSVAALSESLQALNIPLLVLHADTFANIPTLLHDLIPALAIEQLYFNNEYEVNERKRDLAVRRMCESLGIGVHRFHDQCVIPPGEVTTQQQQPFKVFTPFKRAWMVQYSHHQQAPLPQPDARQGTLSRAQQAYLAQCQPCLALDVDPLWPCTESAVHEQLDTFVEQQIEAYHEQRDLPFLDTTSRLSYALALGLLSPRQCLYRAWLANEGRLSSGKPGIDVWISELIWREFYRHLLVAFPNLCKHRAFKPETEAVRWRDSESDFQAWCDGRTGYPIVDAAMRQLRDQGWMHNRLRMISAMFLTKHLLIDWRRGEHFFSQQLVDADLASNNGGWQWSASTGADGAPYFRIFNPTTQSERFDSNGQFIAHYLPKLAILPERSRHNPSTAERLRCGYDMPIVEHRFARQRALDAFKLALNTDQPDNHPAQQTALFTE
ncbi:MAG: deoxyribodipyrimidine photo-lyase [Bacterioplanes sp.]|nr:deoxyribodipyrimidine photo-lyase [Bacterioplanes sp.]